MRRFLSVFLILAILLATLPSRADGWLLGFGVGAPPPASGSSYTGPGDVVSGATAWYGLRAYSASYAGGKSVNVRRASDNTTQDINTLTNGNFDVTSYNSFVGTDATASCTVAGTAAACTGASATIHINDLVTGTGITNSCLVTATNGSTTATISLSGTSTSCGTVGVAETFTFQVAGFATKAYDQSGNSHDAPQATAGQQPQILPTGGPSVSLPEILFTRASNQFLQASLGSTASQPYSFSIVAIDQVGASGFYDAFSTNTGSSQAEFAFNYSGLCFIYAGGSVNTVTSSEATWHAYQALFSGGSSILRVDGSENSVSPGTNATSSSLGIGNDPGNPYNQAIQGAIAEAGIWPSGFSSGNRSSMNSNQHTYWGF